MEIDVNDNNKSEQQNGDVAATEMGSMSEVNSKATSNNVNSKQDNEVFFPLFELIKI